MSYIKLFEEFQPGIQADEKRFLMYVPGNGAFQFTAVAGSEEEMMQIDNTMSSQFQDRVWYQFDLTKKQPGGGFLINKRIVNGPPNVEKYINDPEFEFDTPMGGGERHSNFDDVVDMPTDMDVRGSSTTKDEQPWFDADLVGDIR